jgi:hypothetical protein
MFTGLAAFGSDGTVGKPWREQFGVYGSDGEGRPDTDLSLFGTDILKDFAAYTSLEPSFRNFSTSSGDHGFTVTPAAPGHYTIFLSYSGTQVGTFYKAVHDHDADTVRASLDGHLDSQDTNIGAPLQANFTSVYTPARAGLIDKLNVSGTIANSDAAATYKADVTALLTAAAFEGWTGFRAKYLDRLDADVSSRAVFSDISGFHAETDMLIEAIDDDPWDAPTRSLTDKAGYSLASEQSGVTVGSVGNVVNPVDITYASMTGIDLRLSATHGTGVWDAAGSVSVIPFQGTVSYETAAYGTDVHVVRGDSVAIPYSIGQDITGWTVHFGAKANPSDDTFAIGPKDVTIYVTDEANGSGVITLDTAETSVQPRRYSAELEIRNGPSVNTALRFRLWVDPDVIR